ncbi:MAG: nitroreductase [Halieaceae bacterium]|mgnify:FL=1|jgi:nitroreductase|nr:nitroreductase [Halieaceae bacterium]
MSEQAEAFLNIVANRRSMRAFKPDPVPRAVIEAVMGGAQQAPSNCNTQPWFVHVVTGDTLEQLRATLPTQFAAGEMALDFPYDGQYDGVYKERQYASATALYDALGISRDEKAARNNWFMRNFTFFDAPAVAFFTLPSQFGLREACDLGMYAQTVMLGLVAHGLGSCPQTSLGFMANVIRPALGLGDHEKLMFGLSFGYPTETPVNQVQTERAALHDVVTFHE